MGPRRKRELTPGGCAKVGAARKAARTWSAETCLRFAPGGLPPGRFLAQAAGSKSGDSRDTSMNWAVSQQKMTLSLTDTFSGHTSHAKAIHWYLSVLPSARGFHTCSITELGFVRVSVITGLQLDIKGAKQALDALKSSSKIRFELIPDDLGAAHLPSFVKKTQAITDGHLLELAKKNSMALVTLEEGIPGGLFIG